MLIFFIIVIILFFGFSLRWNWWRLPACGVPILMYHKIGDAPDGSKIKKLWVSKKKFEIQLAYLKKCGYTGITFYDLAQGKSLPHKPVIITFDDGYENNYSSARPLLNQYGYKAVFFIVAGAIGLDNIWHNPGTEKRIRMMNEIQLKELIADGHEIGSHTYTHVSMENADVKLLPDELIKSKEKLEEITKVKIVSFAHPYGRGAFNRVVQDLIRCADYKYACSIKQGKADLDQNRFCLKRLLIRGDDTLFDFVLNLTRGKSRF